MAIWRLLKTREDRPLLNIPLNALKARYSRYQYQVAFGLFSGYLTYYLARMSLGLAKAPLLEAGICTIEQLGLMGSAFYFCYALGKVCHGVLADYAHIPRLIALSLFISCLIECLMGITTSALFLIVLFACNGWFQSVGSAPCCVTLFHWFGSKQRGTGYALWGGMRNIGESLALMTTSFLLTYFDLSTAFIASGLAAFLSGCCVLYFLKDRPATYGLPNVNSLLNEPIDNEPAYNASSVLSIQLGILKSPMLWLIGLACGFLYMIRFSLLSWGPLLLQADFHYSLLESAAMLASFPLSASIGAISAGLLSDRIFQGNRYWPTLLFAIINTFSLYMLLFGPYKTATFTEVWLTVTGFSIGGLMIFLAGLNACESLPAQSVGAVKGLLGIFSYLFAALQEFFSAYLINANLSTSPLDQLDFTQAKYFWLLSSVGMLFFVGLTKTKQPIEPNAHQDKAEC